MKEEKRNNRRVRNLLMSLAFMAILIAVATYAWFIGTGTINVSEFSVDIATTDGLLLSLDGDSWGTTVSINKDNFDTVSYTGNTNSWGGEDGLIPISTIGTMMPLVSRPELFEKSGLPVTPGGHRLISAQIDNWTRPGGNLVPEDRGYVAFDLFVKNSSGRHYFENLDHLDEEAIYLDFDSRVTAAPFGSETGPISTRGIENSVRVGFAEIGRVHGEETNQNRITSITCQDEGGVTGICRQMTIWEPNDRARSEGAENYFNQQCRRRIGELTNLAASFAGPCASVRLNEDSNGLFDYVPTFAVNRPILSSDHVVIYDGLNDWTDTINSATNPDGPLTQVPTFTDTMKGERNVDRQEIFTLTPNSITKVRVYVWLEGQDIDSYDFANVEAAIRVNFGFTKQRFIAEDFPAGFRFDRDGRPADAADKPIIILGEPGGPELTNASPAGLHTNIEVAHNSVWRDNFRAIHDLGTAGIDNLTRKVRVEGTVNTAVPGPYTLRYFVSDWWGNYADSVTRRVIVLPS